MGMNTNSVYQKFEKCSLCNERHNEDKDVYECYNVFRKNNPRKEIEGSIEVWDIERKIWVKRV
jgi:hypothetical protein